jgi:fermentation-respiration switch protein FrsA (DUF1100 family)
MKTIKSDFISKTIRCDADLLLPDNSHKPPVVVMAHGMGAQKDFKLQDFAEKFIAEDMAVFLFDYRSFGKSDGEPRQLVDPFHHLKDWRAAVKHVRKLEEIDASRIALWGSSFSGGHVIATAASDNDIAAVISQIPFVSGLSSLRLKSLPDIFLATIYGMYDLLRAGRNDSLIPLDAVQKLSEKVPDSELIIVDCNHFGPYQGDLFDLFIEKQTGFLRKHLLET